MDKNVMICNQGWKFYLGECEDAWYKGFKDDGFKEVMLPHDWSVEHPFLEEYSSGTGYLRGGIGWYRLHFVLPEEYRGKHIRIAFDGVYKNSQVWVNSYYMGKHPNGYTGFSYDISDLAEFGEEENVVSVKVTHTDIADSRWFTGSGITRKVSLVAEEFIHAQEDGTYLTTDAVENNQAQITIHHEMVNDAEPSCDVMVEARLADPSGKTVLSLKKAVQLDAQAKRQTILKGTMDAPKLWSVEQPNLYRLQIWYMPANGSCYLAEEKEVGIRTIRFDAEQGFFLNGESLKFKGVCIHHDAGCLGAAVTREIWERRLGILKECGCNAVRCSHNPHMPEIYELCDHMGLLMMDEAFDEWENAKNKWSVGHNVYPPKHQGYFEDFREWHERDLSAMVRRDRHHASVVMWSIGNEIDYPNDPYCHPMFDTMTGNNDANKPAAEREFDSNRPNAERMIKIAKELSRIVKLSDESRPVTMALAFPELSAKIGIFETIDIAGYNYKEYLYEEDHKTYPEMPLLGSENGHSYEAWRAVTDHNYISGQFLWTGIDYLGEAYGWPVHGSGAGLLTCAGFKKSRFYRRKAFWSSEEVLVLMTRRDNGENEEWTPCTESWNYEPGEQIVVMCYSNLSEIHLRKNGVEIGCSKEYEADGAYLFHVEFEPGILEAQGYDRDGLLCKTDELKTTGKVADMKITIWNNADKEEQQTGYLYQIELTLVDESGQKVVWEEHKIHASVLGPGVLAGLENGNLSDTTGYQLPARITCYGKLIAYVRRSSYGKIRVEFEVEGFGGKTFEVEMV